MPIHKDLVTIKAVKLQNCEGCEVEYLSLVMGQGQKILTRVRSGQIFFAWVGSDK